MQHASSRRYSETPQGFIQYIECLPTVDDEREIELLGQPHLLFKGCDLFDRVRKVIVEIETQLSDTDTLLGFVPGEVVTHSRTSALPIFGVAWMHSDGKIDIGMRFREQPVLLPTRFVR